MSRRSLVIACACAALLFTLAVAMQQLADRERAKLKSELLYLPNQKLLNHCTAGLNSVVADLLWLRCVQYVGNESKGDRHFNWLNEMLDIVVQLDPYFTDVYRYGGMFLAALKADDDAGLHLLERGIVADPYAWELPYEAAMIFLLNRKEETDSRKRAAYYLAMSVATGKAPELVTDVAAQLQSDYNLVDIERGMWTELLHSQDKVIREMADRKLRELQIREACELLNQRVGEYRQARGEAPKTLAELGLKSEQDDLGGKFFIDQDGEVRNSTLIEMRYTKNKGILRKVLDTFSEREDRWPESLEELVEKDYLEALLPNPWPDRDWRYDAASGSLD